MESCVSSARWLQHTVLQDVVLNISGYCRDAGVKASFQNVSTTVMGVLVSIA